MREIKFRAWDGKKMHYQVRFGGVKDGIPLSPSVWDEKIGWTILSGNPVLEIMQFTGLYDCNGKEIYEGDIARITGGAYWQGYHELDIKGEVVMEYGSFGIREKDGFFNPLLACEPYDGEIRIIGNIFQDGDLLRDS